MNFLRRELIQPSIGHLVRNYAFKSDLKIKWVRPEKVSCIKPEKSGDLSAAEILDPKQFLYDFQNSKELESASELVQNLFRLENNRTKYAGEIGRVKMMDRVRRHQLDTGSMECRLAEMTARIRRLQDSMEKFPRNKVVKVQLKEIIDKRKKFLKYLRRWDYKRFEWVLEKLDLVYKPPPTEFHWITRKDSLRKLTDIHCDTVKETRLAAYRKELEDQQVGFLERKITNLQFIRDGEVECGLPSSVTEEDIRKIQIQFEELCAKRREAAELEQQGKDEF